MTPKPPLLLLHGVTMSAAAWDNVVPLLADRFDLIVPTAAGHRGGPPVSGRATIHALTDATERILDARHLQTVHIAGNSMGGWMAIELARRGRATSVCALSPAGFWIAGDAQDHSRDTLRRTKKLADATRHLTPHLLRFGPVRRITMADIATHAERLSFDQAVHAFNDLVGCVVAYDLLDTSENLQSLDPLPCPITVAWSVKDRIFPPEAFAATVRERLPHARVIVLPHVGHVPMIDDPAMCAQTIIDSIPGLTP
jgi:pimeloyl-ACP methyl ester carboxylesterase